MALGRRVGKQVCRIAAFGQQLWRTGLGTTCGAAQGNSFGSSFEEQHSAALGQQLWRTALGTTLWSCAGEQLWGTVLGSSFEEQLCTAALKNRSFGKHHWGQLWEQFLGVALGQPLCRGALENSFRKLGATNCGEQCCGIAAALTDSCFEERQLWGVALESNF